MVASLSEFRVVLLALALLAGSAAPGSAQSVDYTNPLFGTSARFPAELFPERLPPSPNGDGGTWRAPDGATLAIFGASNTNNDTLQAIAERAATSLPESFEITYQRVEDSWVVLSGYDGDIIFYDRYELGDSGTIHALALRYPQSARGRYDHHIDGIANSLSGP